MTETPQELIARMASPIAWRWHWNGGDEPDVWGYSESLQVSDQHITAEPLFAAPDLHRELAASLAREAVLETALKTARSDTLREAYVKIASASFPVFKTEWTAGQDAAAILALTSIGEAVLAMIQDHPSGEARLVAAEHLVKVLSRTGYRVDHFGVTTLLDAFAMTPIQSALAAFRAAGAPSTKEPTP